MSQKKLFIRIFPLFFLLFAGCAGSSIFPNIPLNPPALSNPISLAIDEGNARGYLVNSNNTVQFANASLIALDLSNPAVPVVIKAVPMDNFSGQTFLDTAARKLYLTNRLSSDQTDKVDQVFRIDVDEASSNFLGIEKFNADNNPFGIASDGTNLYAINEKSVDLYLLSDLTHRTRMDINVQTTAGSTVQTVNTREAALSPSGQFLFVTNRGDRMLIVNVAQIPLPDPTIELTLGGSEAVDYVLSDTTSTRGVASDANFIYVVEGTPPALKILSEQDLPVVTGNPQQILISSLAVAEIPLGNNPNEIALDPLNHRAYVAISDDDQIAVIDTQLFVQTALISLKDNLPAGVKSGENPFAVSVGHFGGKSFIYALNFDTDNVSIIDGDSLTVVGTFP
jgi:hypothetical protein